jgi:tetratricopeptide (TPR) repeat protein
MTNSRGPISGRVPFVGREQEIAELRTATNESSVRIISIYGVRGAGKTTTASQIFYHHRDAGNVFDSAVYLSAHETTEQVLLDELYHMVSRAPKRSYAPAELTALLQIEIEAQAIDRLVFVDNVEDDVVAGEMFGEFLQMLAKTRNRCVLLLTSRIRLPEGIGGAGRREIELAAIREPAAVLNIIGDSMRYRHSQGDLLQMADVMGRLPQRLLYCRWAQPDDIQAFARRFAEQQQPLSMEALRLVLGRVSDPRPLLACGVLRGTDIGKDLLSWLAEQLSDITDEGFGALLDELLGHRLLSPVAGSSNDVRIHPDTHVDLTRLCEQRGTAWMRACHRAAWNYYRRRCADNPDDVSSVGELVHHGLALGDFDSAYAAIFQDNKVERWRQQALSIRVEPMLEELRSVGRLSNVITTQERRASIAVALAHIASDLGRPKLCLEHLTAAQQYLDGIPRTDAVERTLRDLWTQTAISNANLGNTAQCIEYYRRVIDSDGLVLESQTALCMGYLGYEYCDFENFTAARHWTQKALDSCPRDRSSQVFSKNLSNRGLVLYYEGAVNEAAAHLRQAVELVGDPGSDAYDIREQARALSHFAMVELARGRTPAEVDRLLQQSLALTKHAGDVRRIALTEGRSGIVAAAAGDLAQAEELLHGAVLAHYKVGDLRNMIFELLALLAVRHIRMYGSRGRTVNDLERATHGIASDLARLISVSIAQPDKRYLVGFWLRRQYPRLFRELR